MDCIFIQGLRVPTVIGVYPEEHCAPQTLLVDVEMGADVRAAAMTDDLTQTVDYAAVAARIRAYAAGSRFQLLEAFAEGLSGLLLSEFPITALRLKVCKPGAIPEADMVGVIIERRGAL